MFSRFEARGRHELGPVAGDYRREILEPNGTRDPLARLMRGVPRTRAVAGATFLRLLGIEAAPPG